MVRAGQSSGLRVQHGRTNASVPEAPANGERLTWSPELDDIFRESKDVIVKEIERGVRIFDKTNPTCLATGWSKEGIGFWLFQSTVDAHQSDRSAAKTGGE